MTKEELKIQEKTYHINNLAKLFKITEEDAVILFEKLRRIECKLNRMFTIACERSLFESEEETILSLKERAIELTSNIEGLYFNSDPRGYSLKIDDEVRKTLRDKKKINLYSDWGGYGILAPDFN